VAAPHPLVGRVRELALLETHLAREGPPVLLLAGQPGIGKSRLLAEATLLADRAGWRVLAGGCSRSGGQQPYAPLLEAVERDLHRQSPAQLRARLEGCAWLVRLLPELAGGPIEPLPAWTLPPDQERRLVFRAVARFLANVAGPAGTLLLLDDLQWAGPDALDLLTALMRDAAETPLRVVGAYRDTDMRPTDPLSVALADLAHAGLATHCTLALLAAQEAAELFDHLLGDAAEAGPALREQVVDRAGGVPFFLVSYARGLQRSAPDGLTQTIPWDLRQSIRQRVAALPEPAREVLGAAAVLGRTVPRAVLVVAAQRPEREVLVGLEAACCAQLLEETGADAYRFVHDVIREVVEADLGLARRTVLHRQVAQALEQQPGELPIEALAYHYTRSGDQEQAIHYLEQAGDRARTQQAQATAEGYYHDLVARLDNLGRVHDAARVREKLSDVLFTLVRYGEALAVLQQAVEAYGATGDQDSAARAAAQSAYAHSQHGTAGEGLAYLQAVLAGLDTGALLPGLAALYSAMAHLYHWHQGQYQECLDAAERADTLSRVLGDDRLLAPAVHCRALGLEMLGQMDAALPLREEELRVAERVGDLFTLTSGLSDMAHHYYIRGDFRRSRIYSDRALAVAERREDLGYAATVLAFRAFIDTVSGDWDAAHVDAERALAICQQTNAPAGLMSFVSLALGHLHLAEGRLDDAKRYLEEIIEVEPNSLLLMTIRLAQAGLAERDLLLGQPEQAVTRLLPLLDRPGLQELHVTNLLPLLAWAHLELGEIAAAREIVAQAIRRGKVQRNRLALVEALRVQVMVALRQECRPEAEQVLDEGLAVARAVPHPYAEARLLALQGQLSAQKGEPGAARERLAAALAIFRRLGAGRDVEQVERALVGLAQA
jgi:tetratricopeptide (TPR) repeat protein